MKYNSWATQAPAKPMKFDEKAFLAAKLAIWDAHWHQLTPGSRLAYLVEIKGPTVSQNPFAVQPTLAADKLLPSVLNELVEQEFVSVVPSTGKNKPDRVVANLEAADFAKRVRGIHRYRLLQSNLSGELQRYAEWRLLTYEFWQIVAKIAHAHGIEIFYPSEYESFRLINNYRWPSWVARSLATPIAEHVIEAVLEADTPIPRVTLESNLSTKGDPELVRKTIDALLSHLALVEDTDSTNLDIVLGFAPGIRDRLTESKKPKVRPPLEIVSTPRELGPLGGIYVNDLRAIMLEVLAGEPRLRQDRGLFVKEHDRFLSSLETIPGWLAEEIMQSPTQRLSSAVDRGIRLRMFEVREQDKNIRLVLTPKGETWLNAGSAKQYGDLYAAFQLKSEARNFESDYAAELILNSNAFGISHYYDDDYDARFLGSRVGVFSSKDKRRIYQGVQPDPKERDALRDAVGKALMSLPIGVFHTLESVVRHLSYGPSNPLFLGRKPNELRLYFGGKPIADFDEDKEAAGRLLLEALIKVRLIPLGAMHAAVDTEGRLCVVRTNRLGPYFGIGKIEEEPTVAAVGSKVVIQPDFSVVVIGLSTGPLADLAPFCERVTRGGTPGAVQLKITREAVIRAVGHGLTVEQILNRLDTHASHAIPPNVKLEIKEWGGRVRRVSVGTIKIIRCPDRENRRPGRGGPPKIGRTAQRHNPLDRRESHRR